MIFNSLETKVLRAQNDPQLLEKLIAAHLGFIKNCMTDQQKASGAQFEDEMSVAMLAFSEAVLKYEVSKGKFLSFARLVINRRLIDEYRKLNRQSPRGGCSLDETMGGEVGGQHPFEVAASVVLYEEEVKRSQLQMEIAIYEEALCDFGLTFNELVAVSPKQEGLKSAYQAVAEWLTGQPELLNRVYKDQKMPISEILSEFDMDRKKLERGRKYILALVVLLNSELEFLKTYVERR
jgi:RNA polymerase sigma factor